MEMACHISVFKGLVGIFRETVADFKAGQARLLCFSYLGLKYIKVLYCSNYFVDLTPNRLGSISSDKIQNFVVYFNDHDRFVILTKHVKFQAGWKTVSFIDIRVWNALGAKEFEFPLLPKLSYESLKFLLEESFGFAAEWRHEWALKVYRGIKLCNPAVLLFFNSKMLGYSAAHFSEIRNSCGTKLVYEAIKGEPEGSLPFVRSRCDVLYHHVRNWPVNVIFQATEASLVYLDVFLEVDLEPIDERDLKNFKTRPRFPIVCNVVPNNRIKIGKPFPSSSTF